MGYHVSMKINNLVIPADKVADCLKAINDLHNPERLEEKASGWTNNGGLVRNYSWVSNPPPAGFSSLHDAFLAWRYEWLPVVRSMCSGYQKDQEDFKLNYFSGEKLGDDKVLWDAVAPFINPTAEIECVGEDDFHWKWIFKNGKCLEKQGEVIYKE